MLIDALHLPAASRVSVHINKTLLKQQGFKQELIDAITTTNGKKQLFDVAVLNPQTANVTPHDDAKCCCDEVHVFDLTCEPKFADVLEDAIFAHIPYALVVITHCGVKSRFALAKYRTNEADKSKNVITETVRSRWFDADANALASLAPTPDNIDLWDYYCKLFDAVALDNARAIWPEFPDDPACAKRAAEIQSKLSLQIDDLRRKLEREHELNRRIKIADQIRSLKSSIKSLPGLTLDQLEAISLNSQD